ncbi:MAG: ABC transporter ATP-binding protein [Planctomycetes bacterium]|nr:ABC transporter ATP-binding protein [Planctomycetota bacterium]
MSFAGRGSGRTWSPLARAALACCASKVMVVCDDIPLLRPASPRYHAHLPMSLIALDSLARFYGRRRGIEDVSLGVPEGSLFGFLGPNGAGKTTTIRVMLGFLRPTRGSARIFGLDCWRRSREIKAEVGYLPGDLRLYPWLTGRDALRIFGAVRRRDLMRRGRELAGELDLDLGLKVRSMSRGTRQKLGIVLAFAHEPRLLVLDEPTSGLDPLVQDGLRLRLRRLAAEGRTVFFSSHSLAEVESLCDRVAIVRAGRIVADGALEDLRRRAGHEVTIRWKDAAGAASLAPPGFLKIERREGAVWSATLEGPVERLVAWLHGRPFEDLAIGRPDLETLFRRYYEGEGRPT